MQILIEKMPFSLQKVNHRQETVKIVQVYTGTLYQICLTTN
jgi:hypothetical protein